MEVTLRVLEGAKKGAKIPVKKNDFLIGRSQECQLCAGHVLAAEHLEIQEQARGDLVVKSGGGVTVALDPTLDDDLRAEGVARELVNRIQRLRKDSGLEITDRIRLGIFADETVLGALEHHRDFVTGETLATSIETGDASDGDFLATRSVELDGRSATIGISRAGA